MKKAQTLEISSTGLYSSWAYYKPFRLLFDCGEGASNYFRNRAYAIENIFLTHSHADHILGLIGFVGIRNVARGDRDKPLNIYYPKDAYGFGDLIDFIYKRYPNIQYPLNFIPIQKETRIRINDKITLEAFAVEHSQGSLGYRLLEGRTKLKKEYVGQDIGKLLSSGVAKQQITEKYEANVFTYTLDAYRFSSDKVKGCDLWVADATFIFDKDREKNTHTTWREVLDLAQAKGVKKVILAHISPRYTNDEIRNMAYKAQNKYGSLDIYFVDGFSVFKI